MPIPEFEADGFLPVGIHECTPEEISDRFGKFHTTNRRPTLNENLLHYISELKEAKVGKYLIVNGSFVTKKDLPNDIDVLLVLKDDVDLTGNLPPFCRNAFSQKYIRKYYKLDFHCGFEDEASAIEILNYFLEVKYQPGHQKGILKIIL